MTFDFTGKKFLVTGAGRGLGRAIVKSLVAAHGEVYGLDVIKENLDSLVKEFPTVHPIHVDLADWEATRREVDKLGPLDGLVNNAGVFHKLAECLDTEKEELQRVLCINVLGTINVSQSVGKKMVEAGKGGSIVNLSSLASLKAFCEFLPYAISKAAIDMVTKEFATELGPHKIRVNSVNPSLITSTDMSGPLLADAALRTGLLARTPKALPSLEEVVGPVLHLLSDNSTAVTGTVNPVDGGLSCCCLP